MRVALGPRSSNTLSVEKDTLSNGIRSLEEYQKAFPKSRRESAYRLALRTREFEIELYWKRATYFWTLIAATFAAYFALARESSHPKMTFLAVCIGLILSASWFLVNRGSKYWQENWERHVDSLEDELSGPLYKTTIGRGRYRFWEFCRGYPISVSRVNQLASLFVLCVWTGLAIFYFPPKKGFPADGFASWSIATLTAIFLVLLFFFTKTKTENREVDFDRHDLVSADASPTTNEPRIDDGSKPMRDRLKELNTKAYYLLVALSFLYRASSSVLLKLALTLTAIVAVLPLQDYMSSDKTLGRLKWGKVVLLTLALVFALLWVWTAKATISRLNGSIFK